MNELTRSADIANALIAASATSHTGPTTTVALPETGLVIVPEFKSALELRIQNPSLRRPLVHGLLREGETGNVIAVAKSNKLWLVLDLAIAIATGRSWLGRFAVERGDVLIIDNELHAETSADRLPKVAAARGVPLDLLDQTLFVEPLRGRLVDIHQMSTYFRVVKPGRFKVIILDALYRFLPPGVSENDNAEMAQVYNALDRYAAFLGCAFICVHHASKGSQSGKSVVDVGAGAGAQSRAADAHLILRPHITPGVVVLDSAVRSWPPLEPFCLRWEFPVWQRADELNPADLKPDRPARPKTQKSDDTEPAAPVEIWDVDKFVATFCSPTAQLKDTIVSKAVESKLTKREADRWLSRAEDEGRLHRWDGIGGRKLRYSTITQPLLKESDKCT